MPLALWFGSPRRAFQGLNRVAFHRLQDLCRNGSIRLKPPKEMQVRPVIDLRSAAMIARHLTVRAAIGHMHILPDRRQRNSPANKLRPPRPAFGSMRDFMCALSESITWLRSNCSQEM
jgi:hypothetical protein